MARKVRIEYAGAYYHVINRGNYRSWIFESVGAPGKWLWLGIFAKTAWLQTDGWRSQFNGRRRTCFWNFNWRLDHCSHREWDELAGRGELYAESRSWLCDFGSGGFGSIEAKWRALIRFNLLEFDFPLRLTQRSQKTLFEFLLATIVF